MPIYVNGILVGCSNLIVNGSLASAIVNGVAAHIKCHNTYVAINSTGWSRGATQFVSWQGNGQWKFTAPTNSVTWCLTGGGGSGPFQQTSHTGTAWGVGGGFSGKIITELDYSLTPGNVYDVILGNGGSAVTSVPGNPVYLDGNAGANSYFLSREAEGGAGGCYYETPTNCSYSEDPPLPYPICKVGQSQPYKDGMPIASPYSHIIYGGQGSSMGNGGTCRNTDLGGGLYVMQPLALPEWSSGGSAGLLTNEISNQYTGVAGGNGQFYASWYAGNEEEGLGIDLTKEVNFAADSDH